MVKPTITSFRIFSNRRYVSGSRWSLWRWTDVDPGDNGQIYLTRLHLCQTPWFSLMLHWIFRPDPQPNLHDHPVTFFSLLIRGWYVEEVPILASFPKIIQMRRNWYNFKRFTDAHRIIHLNGTVLTLSFAGPVRQQWGFLTPESKIPWREYVAKR